jgi:hypothetical protein
VSFHSLSLHFPPYSVLTTAADSKNDQGSCNACCRIPEAQVDPHRVILESLRVYFLFSLFLLFVFLVLHLPCLSLYFTSLCNSVSILFSISSQLIAWCRISDLAHLQNSASLASFSALEYISAMLSSCTRRACHYLAQSRCNAQDGGPIKAKVQD